MSKSEVYLTIEKNAIAEFKDRGSKFLAYAYPVQSIEETKQIIQQLKKEHAKAVHHCFAYRLGSDRQVFRSNDDGEPSGTAGKPILGQIDSKQLTNILVVVVRYFGGTLLGVPGLINAYKSSSALVLQLVPIVQKSIEVNYEIHFDYTLMNEVMMIIKQCNCSVFLQEQQLFCLLKIGIPKAKLAEVLHRFNDLPTVELKEI